MAFSDRSLSRKPAISIAVNLILTIPKVPLHPAPVFDRIDVQAVVPSTVASPLALATGGTFLLMTLATTASVPVTYAGALVVAATPVVGPAAAVGGAVGVITHDLFRGAVGYWTISTAGWFFGFAGIVAWLAPTPRWTSRLPAPKSRAVPRYIGAVVIAGVVSTAAAAWLTTAMGGGRFYPTAAALLTGIPIAGISGLPVLLIGSRGEGRATDSAGPGASPGIPTTDLVGGRPDLDRFGTITVGTAAGLFAIGLGWLGGGMALDLLAHDLQLFGTERELLRYAAGIFGHGSPVATAGRIFLLGIYRYGEFVVLLSAPVATVAAWGVYRYDGANQPDSDR